MPKIKTCKWQMFKILPDFDDIKYHKTHEGGISNTFIVRYKFMVIYLYSECWHLGIQEIVFFLHTNDEMHLVVLCLNIKIIKYFFSISEFYRLDYVMALQYLKC